jgi:hypothetical protein
MQREALLDLFRYIESRMGIVKYILTQPATGDDGRPVWNGLRDPRAEPRS